MRSRDVNGVMRSVLLVLALLAVPGRLPAQEAGSTEDPTSAYAARSGWFSRDKALHFGISAVGAAGAYVVAREVGLNRWQSAATATLFMGSVGLLREVLDPSNPANLLTRRFLSRRDLVWDAAGIVVGITVPDLLMGSRGRGDRPRAVKPR